MCVNQMGGTSSPCTDVGGTSNEMKSYRIHSRIRRYGRTEGHTNIRTDIFPSFARPDGVALNCVDIIEHAYNFYYINTYLMHTIYIKFPLLFKKFKNCVNM